MLTPIIDENVEKAICRIKCGNENGTAFLVSESIIITACHCIKDHIDGSNVPVEAEFMNIFSDNEPLIINASLLSSDSFDEKKFDIAILKLEKSVRNIKYLQLASAEIPRDAKWETYGYRIVKHTTGDRIKGEVSRTHNNLLKIWDVDLSCEKKDYRGLSGSPVMISEFVVGVIIYDIESLGAISVNKFSEILDKYNIPYQKNIALDNKKTSEIIHKIDDIRNKLDRQTENQNAIPILEKIKTKEFEEKLEKLHKRRRLSDDKVPQAISDLVKELNEFSFVNISIKSEILYYAALWNCEKPEDIPKVDEYLCELKKIDPSRNIRSIEAARLHYQGNTDKAINILSQIDTPEARSQLFAYLKDQKGLKTALEWYDTFDRSFDLLADFGWQNVALTMAETGKWEDALDLIVEYREYNKNASADLAFVEALLRIGFLVADEFREGVLKGAFYFREEFFRQTPEVIEHRKKSLHCLEFVEKEAEKYEAWGRVIAARYWKAWILLTDAERHEEGVDYVRKQMESLKSALYFIKMAEVCDIRINTSLVERHLKQRELIGSLSSEDLIAQLSLVLYQKEPKNIVQFLKDKKQKIIEIIPQRDWATILIENLVLAKEYPEAEIVLLSEKECLKDDAFRFEARIADFRGDDVLDRLIKLYKKNNKMIDLLNLCGYLEAKEDFSTLLDYAKEAYKRNKNTKNAIRVVRCLERFGKYKEIVDFKCEYFIPQSSELQSIKAWAMFYLGQFKEAEALAKKLFENEPNENATALKLNLLFYSGNWEKMREVVEYTMNKFETHSPENLLFMAKSVANVDNELSEKLIQKAVETSPEDIQILSAAGFHLIQQGKEETGFKYLYKAANLSGTDGPIKAFPTHEIKELLLKSKEESEFIHKAFQNSEIPWHLFCHYNNMPLCRPLIALLAQNLKEEDIRKKPLLPVRHGVREDLDLSDVKTIAMDITALYLAESFKLFDKISNCFKTIYIPWETMPILMKEESEARFQQPERIKNAKKFIEVINKNQNFSVFDERSNPPNWLIREVGKNDAELLYVAKEKNGRFVTTLPIYRAGSLLMEHADLKEYNEFIITPEKVVIAMKDEGCLSEFKAEDALNRLKLLSLGESQIATDLGKGPLYISQLAADRFNMIGILSETTQLRECFIDHSTYSEISSLTELEPHEDQVISILERLRKRLRDGIKSGKIICQPLISKNEQRLENLMGLESVLNNLKYVDAVWVDDRVVSKGPRIKDSSGNTALMIGLWDVIKELSNRKKISDCERYELHYQMRKANLIMIPCESDELDYWIGKAKIESDGKIKENAELKAIRQNYQLLISSEYLQLSEERYYWQQYQRTIIKLIIRYWSETPFDITRTKACSEWLMKSLFTFVSNLRHLHKKEVRDWQNILSFEIFQLITISKDVIYKDDYKTWIDDYLLRPLLLSNSEVIKNIAETLKITIQQHYNELSQNMEKKNFSQKAVHYLSKLPALISDYIAEDKTFLKSLDFLSCEELSFGKSPFINQIEFFEAVRQAFKDNKMVEVKNINGQSLRLLPSDKSIKLCYQGKDGADVFIPVPSLGFLHPEKSIRLGALNTAIKELGATHPDKSEWINILNSRPLTDEEILKYFKAIKFTLPDVLDRINEQIIKLAKKESPGITPDFLVPEHIEYFENICAPAPNSAFSKEEYFKQILIPRMQQAIETDLVQGLEMILPMGIRDDLLANQFLENVSDNELQNAIKILSPFQDPVSRINLFDICLHRLNNSSFFADMAYNLLNEMMQENSHLRDDIDVNKLFAVLLRFVSARIRVTPRLREQSIYWQRLCSWTHAGHLMRLLRNWRLEPSWSDYLNTERIPYNITASYLELIEAPSSQDCLTLLFDVKAYIYKHIFNIIKHHNIKKINDFEIEKLFNMQKLMQSGKCYQMLLSGPLETDFKPQPIQEELMNNLEFNQYIQLTESLIQQKDKSTDELTWWRFFLVSQLLEPPQQTYDILLQYLKDIKIIHIPHEQISNLQKALPFMAMVSQKFGSREITEEILRIIIEIIKDDENERKISEYLNIAIVCCTAFGDLEQSIKKYSEFLLDFAYTTKRYELLRFISMIIEDLKMLLPVQYWYFSRIESLCRSI